MGLDWGKTKKWKVETGTLTLTLTLMLMLKDKTLIGELKLAH